MTESQRPKVLLADDEKHIRTLIKTVLSGLQFDVVGEAVNGMEAVDLFKTKQPDLVMLDINMPTMTGDVALREIKALSPGTPVIMLTSVSDMETVEKCLDLGANNYIRKDTPLAEMKQLISDSWQEIQERG